MKTRILKITKVYRDGYEEVKYYPQVRNWLFWEHVNAYATRTVRDISYVGGYSSPEKAQKHLADYLKNISNKYPVKVIEEIL